MTSTGCKAALAVTLFIALSALALATRFALAAPPDIAANAASSEKGQLALDPDDPKFAGYFSGRVTGPDGNPLSRVRVFVAPLRDVLEGELADRTDAGELAVRAETDALGRFEFNAPDMTLNDLDGLPSRRRCIVIATSDGYGPDWIERWGRMRATSYRNPVTGVDLKLQLAADDVPIHGRLLDPAGQPLAGARVRLKGLMVPRQQDLDAHLAREAKDNGFLTATSYHRHLSKPHLVPGLTVEMTTDADGRFMLSGLGRERLAVLSVSAPSVIDTTLTVMTRAAAEVGARPDFKGEPTQVIYGADFTLQLERGLTVRGLVRDRASHEPIPGMWVGMSGETPLVGFATGDSSRITDAQGRFTITGVNPKLLEFDEEHRQIMAVSQPGLAYRSASVALKDDPQIVIESSRGIPFRLKLIDEQAWPVTAEVTYFEVQPNPHVTRTRLESRWPIGRAAQRADGTYEGFVLPGPGALLVKTPAGAGYRAARVDPKAFFAPGRNDWTDEESRAYGTKDTLATMEGWINQHDYTAIVLVNPAVDSGPLELSATVAKDKPRRVNLVDLDGEPVVGVQTSGLTFHPWDHEPMLRAASFSLSGLYPDRALRITFRKEDQQLIGFLLARGDGDAPYTVRMQPWGTVAGRIVDENGQPLPIGRPENDWKGPPTVSLGYSGTVINDDAVVGEGGSVTTDAQGRFRIDKLVPGQLYTAKVSHGMESWNETAFNLVLGPSEVRNLGDIRMKLPYGPEYRHPTLEEQIATATIPAEAWGKPVNDLRAAIVLQSPPVDESERLRYEIVVENIGQREILFGAVAHYENGFHKISIVDSDGKQPPREEGPAPKFADPPRLIRYRLQAKQRTAIWPCATQLVQLDEAGQPTPLASRNEVYHRFNVKPGRYSISAAVELSPNFEYVDPGTRKRTALSPLRGQWTGKLETGVATVELFKGSGK